MQRSTRQLLLVLSAASVCALTAYFVMPARPHVVSPSRGGASEARDDASPTELRPEAADTRKVVEASESPEDQDHAVAEDVDEDVWDFTPGGEDGAFDDMHQPGPLYDPAEFPVMSRGLTILDASEIDRETAIDLAIQRRLIDSPAMCARSMRYIYDVFALDSWNLTYFKFKEENRTQVEAVVERYAVEARPLLDSLDILVEDVTAAFIASRDFVLFEHGTTIPPVRKLGPISLPAYRRIGNWYVDASIDYSGHAAIASIVDELLRLRESMRLELDVLRE